MKNWVYGSGTKIGNDREHCGLLPVHIDYLKKYKGGVLLLNV